MKKLLRIRTSIIVFLLFCGVATLEGLRTHNWINVVFWIAIAIMFLIADNFKIRKIGSQILKDENLEIQ
jgi:hypothetical protein